MLDEIVRDGARAILAAALQAEVPALSRPNLTSAMSEAGGWWSATGRMPSGR
jgi:hypothetical protein